MSGTALAQRVERVAEAALAKQRYVTAIDIFLGLGWRPLASWAVIRRH